MKKYCLTDSAKYEIREFTENALVIIGILLFTIGTILSGAITIELLTGDAAKLTAKSISDYILWSMYVVTVGIWLGILYTQIIRPFFKWLANNIVECDEGE